MGNKADVSGNDLLSWWEQDNATSVILLYLESFGNPRKFARLARRLGRVKPIVAVKGGRTSAGSRAASSHTAALASSDEVVDNLFHQTGVMRVDTIEELFDIGRGLRRSAPPGRTAGGGHEQRRRTGRARHRRLHGARPPRPRVLGPPPGAAADCLPDGRVSNPIDLGA